MNECMHTMTHALLVPVRFTMTHRKMQSSTSEIQTKQTGVLGNTVLVFAMHKI